MFANPYALSDRALAAWRARDAEQWAELQVLDAPAPEFARFAPLPEDRIRALYLQGDVPTADVAAVIRDPKHPDGPVWIRLRRRASGGFGVVDLVVGEAPRMEDYLEGR
jgi:hypothetical protein